MFSLWQFPLSPPPVPPVHIPPPVQFPGQSLSHLPDNHASDLETTSTEVIFSSEMIEELKNGTSSVKEYLIFFPRTDPNLGPT